MDLGLLVLRLVLGLTIIGHSTHKIVGGTDGAAAYFESVGIRPGTANAWLAGLSEVTAGVLLIAGLLTPLAVCLATAVLVTAIIVGHAPKGFWDKDGGAEYLIVFVAALFALAAVGPGEWSLDHQLELDLDGAGWAIAAVGTGALGAVMTVVVGRWLGRQAQRPTA
jgi:putative oxidoreductase